MCVHCSVGTISPIWYTASSLLGLSRMQTRLAFLPSTKVPWWLDWLTQFLLLLLLLPSSEMWRWQQWRRRERRKDARMRERERRKGSLARSLNGSNMSISVVRLSYQTWQFFTDMCTLSYSAQGPKRVSDQSEGDLLHTWLVFPAAQIRFLGLIVSRSVSSFLGKKAPKDGETLSNRKTCC